MTLTVKNLGDHCPKPESVHQQQLGGFLQCLLVCYIVSQSYLAELCQDVADEIDAYDHLSLLGPVSQLSLLAIMHIPPRFIHLALGTVQAGGI